MAHLRVENLSISFGGLKALNRVSFAVQKGEIYSIIGPNGAGKTTVFNCISGLYKPDEGKILFKDRDISSLKPYQVAEIGIARTFQNIELFSHMTTMDNLMLGRHTKRKYGLWSGCSFLNSKSPAAQEEIRMLRIVALHLYKVQFYQEEKAEQIVHNYEFLSIIVLNQQILLKHLE